MSKAVPAIYVPPTINDFRTGQDVLLSSFETTAEALHYIYGREGTRLPGPVFDTPLDPWKTTSTSYTSVNSGTSPGAHYDLNDWQGLFIFSRRIYGSGANDQAFNVTFDCFAQNLNVRCTMTRLDTVDGHTGSSTTFNVHTTTRHGQRLAA